MKTRLLLTLALLPGGIAGHAQEIDVPRLEFSNPALRVLQNFSAQGWRDRPSGRGHRRRRDDRRPRRRGCRRDSRPRRNWPAPRKSSGSFVVVGGTGVIAEGARVHEDVFALGGLDAAPRLQPGWESHRDWNRVARRTADGARAVGDARARLRTADRPRPGDGSGDVAIIFFLLNLLLNLLFDGPVRACASALRATPVSAFLTGLLVMLLAGPLCLLLAISVVGIAVIPFAIGGVAAGRHRRTDWICAVAGHERHAPGRSREPAAVAALVPDRLGDHVRRLRHPGDRAAHVGDGRGLRSWRRDAGVHARLQARESKAAPEGRRRFRPRPPPVTAAGTHRAGRDADRERRSTSRSSPSRIFRRPPRRPPPPPARPTCCRVPARRSSSGSPRSASTSSSS